MRMDGQQFDALILRLQRTIDRRHAISGLVAGSAALAGIPLSAEAKKRGKRKKKRCGRLQATCRSNKACCPGRTGRVCANNDKDVHVAEAATFVACHSMRLAATMRASAAFCSNGRTAGQLATIALPTPDR
jgi:hypothetical protein